MRLTVFGATGGTGQQLVRQWLDGTGGVAGREASGHWCRLSQDPRHCLSAADEAAVGPAAARSRGNIMVNSLLPVIC